MLVFFFSFIISFIVQLNYRQSIIMIKDEFRRQEFVTFYIEYMGKENLIEILINKVKNAFSRSCVC